MTLLEGDKDSALITCLKVPPSAKDQFLVGFESKVYKEFQLSVDEFPFKFPNHFASCKKKVHDWVDNQKRVLQVYCTFFVKEHRLYTKQQEPRMFEMSSRIKLCQEKIAKLMDVDERHFFRVVGEKCIAHHDLGEMACIEIIPYR